MSERGTSPSAEDRLPENPFAALNDYDVRHVVAHLVYAGQDRDVHRLLRLEIGEERRNGWFGERERRGDVDGYLRDVGWARSSAQRMSLQLRYALIEASIASLSVTPPSALIGELIAKGLWTTEYAFGLIERMTDELRQARALACIASSLPIELHARALSVAISCREEKNRAAALEAVIPVLSGDLLDLAAEAVFSLEHSPGFSLAPMEISPNLYLNAMVAIAAKLPPERLRQLIRRYARIYNQVGYVRGAYSLFIADDRLQGARNALQTARELDNKHDRGLLVAALIRHFPPDALDDVFAVLETTHYLDAPMIALAEHAPATLLDDVLGFAQGRWYPKPDFFRMAASRLTMKQLPAALRLCKSARLEGERAEAFAALAPLLDADQARVLLAPDQSGSLHHPVIVEDLDLYHDPSWLVAVSALLDRLPPGEARKAASEQIAPSISGSYTYESELALLGRHLPGELRRTALSRIYEGLRQPGSSPEESAALLLRFIPLSDSEITEAFDQAQANSRSEALLTVTGVLASHLPDRILYEALRRVREFPLEQECFAALAALGRLQPEKARDQTAQRGLAMATNISHLRSKANAVAALMPVLVRPELAATAFVILWSVDPSWGVRAMEEMADVLPAELLQVVPGRIRGWINPDPALDIPRILERLSGEGYTAVIDSLLPGPEGSWEPYHWEKVLSRLALLLSPSQARRLWDTWDRDDTGLYTAEALSALVGRLPEHERAAAVNEVLAIYTPGSRSDYRTEARTLGRLARAASTERLTRAIDELLDRERTVKEWVLEELAPGLPEMLIEKALQYALSDDDDLSCKSLAWLAPRLSGALLDQAIAHVIEVGDPRWKAVALTPLARQLPHDSEDRETVLAMALEMAAASPLQSKVKGVMANLIPQLPERLRAPVISATADEVCSDLRSHQQPEGEEFDRLQAVLALLRGSELRQLYARLGEEIRAPQVRAHAQATIIKQAGGEDTAAFLTDGPPLHHDWPGDFDRAALMELIAAAAWWIDQNSRGTAIDEVIEAILDVARWWP